MNWQPSDRPPALIAHPPAASLDEAHSAIDLWEFYSRKRLDAEQRLSVELMMAETGDGRWAADTTGRAEARQNGKGDEIEVVELHGLTQRGEAILHTAHEAATAASAHGRLVALVEGHRDLARRVRKKQSWNGNYSLILSNDAIIVWRTRTGAGGRGLDDISRIVIDEAQHAQAEELASSLPTLAVNPNPQKNFIGSGGVAGKSTFWWRQRLRALQSSPGRFSWLEHSAETITLDEDGRVVSTVGDVRDPATWRQANPAYPSRISHDFLLDQLEVLTPDLFAREHLCVWDPAPELASSLIPPDVWAGDRDDTSTATDPVAFGFDVTPDRSSASIGMAGLRADGLVHVEVIDNRPGTGWVVGRLAELKARWKPCAVAADPAGPAGSLFVPLDEAGVTAEEVAGRQFTQACGGIYDDIMDGRIRHLDQRELNRAVAAAQRRKLGDAWAFARRDLTDISPLVAVTVARDALLRRKRVPAPVTARAAPEGPGFFDDTSRLDL